MSSPKPGYTSGESGRGARRGGGTGSGRTERRQNSSPRIQASKIRRLEARTSEILCEPEEHNERLITGLSAVYSRFITGTRSALCFWLLTSGLNLFCLCKPFSCKACPRICSFILYSPVESKTRIRIPPASRGGRKGERRGGAGQSGTPTDQFAQETSVHRNLQNIENTKHVS